MARRLWALPVMKYYDKEAKTRFSQFYQEDEE